MDTLPPFLSGNPPNPKPESPPIVNFDALIPVLDALSKTAEASPFPYVVLGGVIMAGLVAVLRQVRLVQGKPVLTLPPLDKEVKP